MSTCSWRVAWPGPLAMPSSRHPSRGIRSSYVCRWHDRGWRDLDENPPLDPRTGLPYHLGETPIEITMLTSATSPHHNEAVHPYCGLLDSMHITGLYHGRYGLSDWKANRHGFRALTAARST